MKRIIGVVLALIVATDCFAEGVIPKNIESCRKNSFVLDRFVAHEVDLVSSHSAVLDNIAKKLIKSFGYCARPFDHIEIIGHGAPYGNIPESVVLDRSLKRADRVRFEISNRISQDYRENINIWINGVGSSIPVDTNDTQDGRANNRRVEVRLCRTYNTMYDDLREIRRKDFNVYPNDFKREEVRCLTKQLKGWSKKPKNALPSLRRFAKKMYADVYMEVPKKCGRNDFREKIALERRKLKRNLFGSLEHKYKDMAVTESLYTSVLDVSSMRKIWKSQTCKDLRKLRKRAEDKNDLLYCFSGRINDPERFDLCLSEKP